MHISRAPCDPLRPFVQRLWLVDEAGQRADSLREHVVPTGAMHIVLRLNDQPLRIYDTLDARTARTVGSAVVGGARATYYVRDVSRPSCAVGAMLTPGAALPLLGVPAEPLAERHTVLDDLWGPEVDRVRERLLTLRSPAERLDLFEALLARRLPRVRGIHPAVAHALERFDTLAADVRTVVLESGYSHRRFITLFRQAVGLSPKQYARVTRFRRMLQRFEAAPGRSWSQIALAAGFSDQAHLAREFRDIAGVTPTQFQHLVPRHTHHVPAQAPVQFSSRRGR